MLDVAKGDFKFVDSTRSTLSSSQKIQCHMTLRTGEIVWDLHGRSFSDWRECIPGGLDAEALLAQIHQRKARTGSSLPPESILRHRDAERR